MFVLIFNQYKIKIFSYFKVCYFVIMSFIERNGLYYLNGEIIYFYTCDGTVANGISRPTITINCANKIKACDTREDKEKQLLNVLFDIFNIQIKICWKDSQTKTPETTETTETPTFAEKYIDAKSLKNVGNPPSHANFIFYYICFDTRKVFNLYKLNGEFSYKIHDSM